MIAESAGSARRARASVVLLAGLLLAIAGPLRAQSEPKSGSKSGPRSEVTPESTSKCPPPIDSPIVAVLVLSFAAPALLLDFVCDADYQPPPPAISYRAITLTKFAFGDTSTSSGGSGSIEWAWRGNYVEARVAEWNAAGTYRYDRVRFGRLLHPMPELYGGVTFGFQRVRHDRTQQGIEVGLPLVVIHGKTLWRSEATYVASSERVNINYRFRWDRQLGTSPFRSGIDVEFKRVMQSGPVTSGVSLVLEWRQ